VKLNSELYIDYQVTFTSKTNFQAEWRCENIQKNIWTEAVDTGGQANPASVTRNDASCYKQAASEVTRVARFTRSSRLID